MILDQQMNALRLHLRDNLSHERYRHCIGVMCAMMRSAEMYGLDIRQASLAGLLHDIAHELPNERLIALLAEHDPDRLQALTDDHCLHNAYLHGPAAVPLICGLGITDPTILTAVRQHVGDHPNMDLLTRCLFVADMTAPTVGFPGVTKLSKLYFSGRLDEAELLLIVRSIESQPQRGIPVHPQYLKRREELSRIIEPSSDFFSRETPFVFSP